MAKKIKITRKQMKQPDDFLSWTEQLWDWAERNIWQAVGIVAAVVVILFGAQAVVSWVRTRGDTSNDDMAKAMKVLEAPVIPAESMNLPNLPQLRFTSDQEHDKAALGSFEAIIANYTGGANYEMAMFFAARLSEKLDNYSKAIDLYTKFLGTSTAAKDLDMQNSANLGLGRCYFSDQQYQKALDIFIKIIDSPSSFQADAMMYAARSYYYLGQDEKGKELLARLKKEYPDSWIATPADFLAQYLPEEVKKAKINPKVPANTSGNLSGSTLLPIPAIGNTAGPGGNLAPSALPVTPAPQSASTVPAGTPASPTPSAPPSAPPQSSIPPVPSAPPAALPPVAPAPPTPQPSGASVIGR